MALVPDFLGFRRKPYHLVRYDGPRPAAAPAEAATPEPEPRKADGPPPLKSAGQMVKEYLAEPDGPPAGFTAVPGKPGEYRYGPNADGALWTDGVATHRAFALAAGRTRDPELCDLHRRLADAYQLWRTCRAPACRRAKACSRSTTIACVHEQRDVLEPHLPDLHRALKAKMQANGDW